jgi:hypothetical protein
MAGSCNGDFFLPGHFRHDAQVFQYLDGGNGGRKGSFQFLPHPLDREARHHGKQLEQPAAGTANLGCFEEAAPVRRDQSGDGDDAAFGVIGGLDDAFEEERGPGFPVALGADNREVCLLT